MRVQEDEPALAKLPVDEQKALAQQWADVVALLKKAEPPRRRRASDERSPSPEQLTPRAVCALRSDTPK